MFDHHSLRFLTNNFLKSTNWVAECARTVCLNHKWISTQTTFMTRRLIAVGGSAKLGGLKVRYQTDMHQGEVTRTEIFSDKSEVLNCKAHVNKPQYTITANAKMKKCPCFLCSLSVNIYIGNFIFLSLLF